MYKIQTVELVWPRAKDRLRKAPSRNFEMVPIWKTKKGKISNLCMLEVTIGMRERGIDGLEWVDREGWRLID